MSAVPHAASLPPRRLGTLQRPDCRLAYEVTGEGPPILFLHGLGGNHLSWWQQIAHFSATHMCVALSARGFLPSTSPPGGPDPKDFSGDIAALVDTLGLQRVVLVGQSMGGWGALEYAIAHPSKVRALVMAATTGTIDATRIEGPEQERLASWQAASRAATNDLASRNMHVAGGLRLATEQPALHLLYRHIDDMNAGLDKMAMRDRLFRARARPPADIGQVACPVLFLSGDEDIVIPPFAADAIARHKAGTQVHHFPNAGHSAYFERAADFNRVLGAFLAGLGA
jgi:3-oxoadipate enol-lactonase